MTQARLVGRIGEGSLVLDAGAGSGGATKILLSLGCEVVSLDFAIEGARKLKTSVPDAHAIIGDVRCLPFKENTFDSEVLWGTLEYSGLIERTFAEAHRVVRNGLIFTGWNDLGPISFLARIPYRGRKPQLFSVHDIGGILSTYGFEIKEIEGLFFILPSQLRILRGISKRLKLPVDKLAMITARINRRITKSKLGTHVCPVVEFFAQRMTD
ncbi:MAG: hypothetical protein AUJ07_04425 [Crenarchaeota archaeon 13_1_40CM_3_53_5]|nr:MAG: hypothetical protein AUJ07_04425 [Crenarchaeota archaeon 13_1_40CM_3_53_5]